MGFVGVCWVLVCVLFGVAGHCWRCWVSLRGVGVCDGCVLHADWCWPVMVGVGLFLLVSLGGCWSSLVVCCLAWCWLVVMAYGCCWWAVVGTAGVVGAGL